jgi:hypothetical protein
MDSASLAMLEPEPLEIDPVRYELCGCLIEDFEALIYVRAVELAAQWEAADPRDSWRHTGEPRPPALNLPSAPARPYRTPQATIDAFWYVVRLDNPDYLTGWLARHPLDASTLCKLWEGKNAA